MPDLIVSPVTVTSQPEETQVEAATVCESRMVRVAVPVSLILTEHAATPVTPIVHDCATVVDVAPREPATLVSEL